MRETGAALTAGRLRLPVASDISCEAAKGRASAYEARLAFEKMLTHLNHVGLYVEQIGRAGRQARERPPRR